MLQWGVVELSVGRMSGAPLKIAAAAAAAAAAELAAIAILGSSRVTVTPPLTLSAGFQGGRGSRGIKIQNKNPQRAKQSMSSLAAVSKIKS